jgi:GABA(A) receptor-associated protein
MMSRPSAAAAGGSPPPPAAGPAAASSSYSSSSSAAASAASAASAAASAAAAAVAAAVAGPAASYRDSTTLEKRLAESQRIRAKYPDRIPVIVERAANRTAVPQIDKNKFLVPSDLSVGGCGRAASGSALLPRCAPLASSGARALRAARAARAASRGPRRAATTSGPSPPSHRPRHARTRYTRRTRSRAGQFIYVIRKRLSLTADKALFIFISNTLPPTSMLMREVYALHADAADGFLYVMCVAPRTVTRVRARVRAREHGPDVASRAASRRALALALTRPRAMHAFLYLPAGTAASRPSARAERR